MPHADAATLPSTIDTKAEFWSYVYDQLSHLLEGQQNWISNLANTSSLIYHSLRSYEAFGIGDRSVNWCGFYIASQYMPTPRTVTGANTSTAEVLLLGPFSGKPACQFIQVPQTPRDEARFLTGSGVCSDAYYFKKTLLVPVVDDYPGHIACDGETKSELVIPLFSRDGSECIGVLDLDCLALNGFEDEDRKGLEAIAKLVGEAGEWVKWA